MTINSAFHGFTPFDEGATDAFHGRGEDTARLDRLCAGTSRVIVLSGPCGVGKTSLVRAGLVPLLKRRNISTVYIGAYQDLDAEVVRATTHLQVNPPAPNQSAADYLARVARESPVGTLLILDHLEEALADEVGLGAELGALVARVLEAGGNRLRLLLCIDETSFAHLDLLRDIADVAVGAGAWMTLPPLTEAQCEEILEKNAVQSGTPFESGLASAVATDLTRDGPCRALDLELAARAIVVLRLGSLRRYRRSGGASVLPASFFDWACSELGGRVARRALLAVSARGELAADALEVTTKARAAVAEALAGLKTRGVLVSRPGDRREVYALAHPGLRPNVEAFAIEDRARAATARRTLRRRLTANERLRLPELWAVHRHLGGELAADERATFVRSLRRTAIVAALGVALVVAAGVGLHANLGRSYTLGFEPRGHDGAARVVVRLGRQRLAFFNFLPNSPRLGSILADTGFATGSLGPESVARIGEGRISGTFEAQPPGGAAAAGAETARGPATPGWLREVLNRLRPVPRGVSKALLGDPDGVTALKNAFSDPAARRETLEALAVIGRGRAGEDEILGAALADGAPEIRRRGVEVAASIDRRLAAGTPDGNRAPPANGGTLRSALADKSIDVRAAVLREAATLPADEAASILAVALRDPDAAFRREAEEATRLLAARAPTAAAQALEKVLESPDGGIRRAALALLEAVATRAPAECLGALTHLAENEQAPEEARVSALSMLRRAGPPAPALKPLLEKAVRPESSPRLRTAALPLFAQLVSPEEAEEIARTEMKGAPAGRAGGAAVWGAVAMNRPDLAAKPLKGLIYDPSTETRLEAVRAFAYLKRDGVALVEKALKDSSPDVQRAAVESALALAPAFTGPIADVLGHAVKNVRPSVRTTVIEALARVGEEKPAVVLLPLAHALHDTDTGLRAAAASAFCALGKKHAAEVSPYLRVAASDARDQVRTAAAACLAELAEADPKGATKIATELSAAKEAPVRMAAAQALGRLGEKAPDMAFPALLTLIADPEHDVRVAGQRAFGAVAEKVDLGDASKQDGRREAERALDAALVQGDAPERRTVIAAAAKARLPGVLRQASADGDESVRLEAVRAAGALGGPALEVVRSAVDDGANAVRAEATRILAAASGGGAREVLPIFASMLRGGDPAAREAAVIGVGELGGAGAAGAELLGEALGARSESLRTAAARALGRLAEREPDQALAYLERAARDPSYDVRSAAIPGLARAWSLKQTPEALGATLAGAEADSMRRFVALEALALKSGNKAESARARRVLDDLAAGPAPLARLAAQIGRSFWDTPLPEMHRFIERLLGG
jgi:HEAT repeat protein